MIPTTQRDPVWLQQQIAAHPADLSLRLHFAAALEELLRQRSSDQSLAARVKLIREQLILRGLDPRSREAAPHLRTVAALIAAHSQDPAWQPREKGGATAWGYHLGCVSSLRITAAELRRLPGASNPDSLFHWEPIRFLEIAPAARPEDTWELRRVLLDGRYAHVIALDLSGCHLDDALLAAFTETALARNLVWLSLSRNPLLTRSSLRIMAERLRGLRYVELNGVKDYPLANDDGELPPLGREFEQSLGRVEWLHNDSWVGPSFPPTPFQLLDLLERRAAATTA